MILQAALVIILISTSFAPSSVVRVQDKRDGNSVLLEVGRATADISASGNAPALKIVSYNIRWRSGKEL
ncbi:MAG TPA: hypothetical protein VFR80_16380, partial [Pyrinomonadaceae bacterium]|nr:hypothetical protein [Pyrinomonadaceae bacterium]